MTLVSLAVPRWTVTVAWRSDPVLAAAVAVMASFPMPLVLLRESHPASELAVAVVPVGEISPTVSWIPSPAAMALAVAGVTETPSAAACCDRLAWALAVPRWTESVPVLDVPALLAAVTVSVSLPDPLVLSRLNPVPVTLAVQEPLAVKVNAWVPPAADHSLLVGLRLALSCC